MIKFFTVFLNFKQLMARWISVVAKYDIFND